MSYHTLPYHFILYDSHVGMWVEKAAHSRILVWRIPWTEQPGGLRSRRVSKSQKWLTERLSSEMWELDHRGSRVLKNGCFQMRSWRRLENPWNCKEIQPVHPKVNQLWILIKRTNAEAEAPILWPPDAKTCLMAKDPDTGKDWRKKKGSAEDEIFRCHHWFNGHEFKQTPGNSEGQSRACCSPCGYRELVTEQQYINKICINRFTFSLDYNCFKMQFMLFMWLHPELCHSTRCNA